MSQRISASSLLLTLVAATYVAGCGGSAVVDPCATSSTGASWIAYSTRTSAKYGISMMRTDGTCERTVSEAPGNALFAAWKPDGSTIAFSSDGAGTMRIFVHDLATGSEAPLDLGALGSTSPAYSAAGQLAFEGMAPGTTTSDLYVVPSGGGASVQLTRDARLNGGPVWAPDRDTIFFVSNRSGTWDVYRISASAGGEPQPVTNRSRIVGKPAVSPDGTLLAFARTVAGSSDTEVVTYDLSTGTVRVVSSQSDSEPTFSPSGTELVVRSYRTGCSELFLLDLHAGGVVRQLTSDCVLKGLPAVAPAR